MRQLEECVTWVVYRMTIYGKPSGRQAVCEQGEWEAMERARPGYHTLLLAGITNEGEAERLARSTRWAVPRAGPPSRTSRHDKQEKWHPTGSDVPGTTSPARSLALQTTRPDPP